MVPFNVEPLNQNHLMVLLNRMNPRFPNPFRKIPVLLMAGNHNCCSYEKMLLHAIKPKAMEHVSSGRFKFSIGPI